MMHGTTSLKIKCYVLISEQTATFADNIDWLTFILYLLLWYIILYWRKQPGSQLKTFLLSKFIICYMFRPE